MRDADRAARTPDEERAPLPVPAQPSALGQLDRGTAGSMVIAMQQGQGNAYVSRMLASGGRGAPVLARDPLTPFGGLADSPFRTGGMQEKATPEGGSHGTPEDQLRVAKWVDTPAIAGPEVPVPVAIDVPQYAPKPVGWRSAQQGPGGLKPPYDFPGMDGTRPTGPPVMAVEAEAQRREVWSSYRVLVSDTVTAHNALVMPIATYEGFAADPSVAAAGFHLPDLAELALKKVVPKTSASKVTVGSLFTPAARAGGPAPAPGTDVQTQGLGDNMAKAKKSSAVEQQRMQIDAAELDVLGQLKAIKRVVLESEQAGHTLQAASAGVAHLDAEGKKEQGEKELKAAKEKGEEMTAWIGRGLKVVALMSGALAPIVIAGEAVSAAADSGGGGVAGKVKSVAESGITSTIAGKVVDLVNSGEIAAATKKIAEAEREMAAAKGQQVRETEQGAKKGFAASLIAVEEATIELKEKMKRREAALMAFGNAAAAAGGGSQREQDRMRALVQALPVVESVVATTDNIRAAIQLPAQSDEAGRGLNLSLYAGYGDAQRFLHTVGLIKGYQERFTGVRDEWQQRLVSLRGAVNAMSASDEGS